MGARVGPQPGSGGEAGSGGVRVRSAPLWNERCYGCTNDCTSCCAVLWCPCVHIGEKEQLFFPPLDMQQQQQHQQQQPENQCCYCPQCACCISGTACVTAAFCWPVMCCYNYGHRKKVRERYQYEMNNTEDCCLACWCLPCSMCQVAREVKLGEFMKKAQKKGRAGGVGEPPRPMAPPSE